MTLQELKDNYAQEQGYLSWEELHMVCQFEGKNLEFAKYIDAVIILAQQEALNNASRNALMFDGKTEMRSLLYTDESLESIGVTIVMDSITSESNLIK